MESLKKNADFKNCYENGKSYVNRDLVLYLCGNGLGKNRIGITVSKKVGNSVVRHRVTRLIREAYRLHEDRLDVSVCAQKTRSERSLSTLIGQGWDLVFVARVRASEADYFRIEKSLLHLAGKAGILSNSSGKK